MRRLLTLGLLAAFLVALAGVPQGGTGSSSSDHSASDAAAPGSVGTSHPSDDGAYWRRAHATSAAVAASPWRVHELHAQLATLSVFVEFAAVQASVRRVDDSRRPHAPPHSLNDSLRI